MTDNPQIARARSLRQGATITEQQAWKTLRTLRKQGYAVRRQHPAGPVIIDFAIDRLKLAIEIDGGIHRLENVAEKDRQRDALLTEMGWTVLRIKAEHALSPDYLIDQVKNALKQIETK